MYIGPVFAIFSKLQNNDRSQGSPSAQSNIPGNKEPQAPITWGPNSWAWDRLNVCADDPIWFLCVERLVSNTQQADDLKKVSQEEEAHVPEASGTNPEIAYAWTL